MKKSILLLFILTLVLSFSLLGCNNNQGDEEKEHEHTYEETVFLPTCLEKGYTVRLCTGCGETTNYNFVKQSEHTAGEWTVTKESTCKSVGSREQRCVYCDKVMTYDSVPLGEHVTAWTTTKLPTCSTMGTEELKCTVCGKSVDARATETTDNHEFELFVTPPTEDKDGYTTYKCKRCSHSEVGDYVKLENKELTAQEIYEKIAGATVKVFAYDKSGKQFSSGSGFVVTNDGKLITNFHVIDGAYTVKVKFYSGEFYNVTNVLGYDKSNDVAVIKITIDTDKYLNISTEKVKTGDTVYALGSPLGVENIFSQGIVSRESISANGIDCIAFTAPISPGNSGGPLVNTKGEVIGINSMYMPDGQNLNFAISFLALFNYFTLFLIANRRHCNNNFFRLKLPSNLNHVENLADNPYTTYKLPYLVFVVIKNGYWHVTKFISRVKFLNKHSACVPTAYYYNSNFLISFFICAENSTKIIEKAIKEPT